MAHELQVRRRVRDLDRVLQRGFHEPRRGAGRARALRRTRDVRQPVRGYERDDFAVSQPASRSRGLPGRARRDRARDRARWFRARRRRRRRGRRGRRGRASTTARVDVDVVVVVAGRRRFGGALCTLRAAPVRRRRRGSSRAWGDASRERDRRGVRDGMGLGGWTRGGEGRGRTRTIRRGNIDRRAGNRNTRQRAPRSSTRSRRVRAHLRTMPPRLASPTCCPRCHTPPSRAIRHDGVRALREWRAVRPLGTAVSARELSPSCEVNNRIDGSSSDGEFRPRSTDDLIGTRHVLERRSE